MQNLCSTDFFKKTKFNAETQTQLWMSNIGDSHDIFCDCDTPFAHLLASIFPPGHTDRNKTIEQILIRDFNQKCHSGGTAEKNLGMASAFAEDGERDGLKEEKEEDIIKDEDLQELIDAGEDAITR